MKKNFSFVVICLLFAVSCVFNANMPLVNDRPICLNPSVMQNLLLSFPDSSLCTLQISDKNDSLFSLSALPCVDSISGADSDSPPQSPWPGSFELISGGYDTKLLRIFYPTNFMGNFCGTLVIRDQAGATATVPFSVQKFFCDPFDTPPLRDRFWQSYTQDDPAIRFSDEKLMFLFSINDPSGAAPTSISTGLRSRFSLSDTFLTSVEFKLRDEMSDHFTIAFFVSSSRDTGEWSGKKAGIFISGGGNGAHLECRSVDFQSYGFDTTVISGKLGIGRSGSWISYFLRDNDSEKNPFSANIYSFPPDCPVFIHLKMTVDDRSKDRHCSWNNLTVYKGCLSF
jgi:hypothetical protein